MHLQKLQVGKSSSALSQHHTVTLLFYHISTTPVLLSTPLALLIKEARACVCERRSVIISQ